MVPNHMIGMLPGWHFSRQAVWWKTVEDIIVLGVERTIPSIHHRSGLGLRLGFGLHWLRWRWHHRHWHQIQWLLQQNFSRIKNQKQASQTQSLMSSTRTGDRLRSRAAIASSEQGARFKTRETMHLPQTATSFIPWAHGMVAKMSKLTANDHTSKSQSLSTHSSCGPFTADLRRFTRSPRTRAVHHPHPQVQSHSQRPVG